MHLLPECIVALKYPAFWESTDGAPLLKKFLDFDFQLIRNLSTPTTLQTVMFVVGTTVMSVGERLSCLLESKQSSLIKRFWKIQNENQNIMMKNKLTEEKAKVKVQKLQSTTASIAKRFLNNDNEKTAKHTRTHKAQPDEDDSESDEDRDYLNDSAKSPTMTHEETDDEIENQNHARFQSNLLGGNDVKDAISQSSKIPNMESICRASAESLASLDGVKYFGEFIPLFEKYKEQEKHNVYSCTNDDVMDIRGDSDFAKFLTINQYAKLLSVRPKRNAALLESWRSIIEEYYMESLTEGGPKKTITDWVRITNALIVDKVGDTEEVKRLKKYLYRVMLP
ncbi:637_t:CDS:10, partial [Paraglomus occultum]